MAVSLSACGGDATGLDREVGGDRNERRAQAIRERSGSIFGGDGGLTLFGSGDDEPEGGGTGIGVNSYLWRATLDTVSFLPVNSADPFGGVIITDWYSPDGSADERFKLNIYILDTQLRADGIRVQVFRQVRDGADWVDAPVETETSVTIEDAILTRAREMRIADVSAS